METGGQNRPIPRGINPADGCRFRGSEISWRNEDSLLHLGSKVFGRQGFAGGLFDELGPGIAATGKEDLPGEELAEVLSAVEAQFASRAVVIGKGGEGVAELGGEEFTELVIVVIDGGDGEMGFGGPVGVDVAGRTAEHLESLLVIPPQGVEGSVRVLVEDFFHMEHDERPAGEDELLTSPLLLDGVGKYVDLCGIGAGVGDDPGGRFGQGAEKHGDGLGGEDVGWCAKIPWEGGIEPKVVNGVPLFVEHGVHPLGRGLDIAESPYVAFSIDIGAEGVLVLAWSLVEIAAFDHTVDGQADVGIELSGDFGDVLLLLLFVEDVEIDGLGRWGRLEERVIVVPGHDLVDLDAESRCDLGVHGRLHFGEGIAGQCFEFLKDRHQLFGVVLLQLDLHLPVVLEVERLCSAVAELGQFDDLGSDDSADLLESSPDLLAAGGVVFVGKHFEEVIVREGFAVETCAKGVERFLDLRGEVDQLFEHGRRELVATKTEFGASERAGLNRSELVDDGKAACDAGVCFGIAVVLSFGKGECGRLVVVFSLP